MDIRIHPEFIERLSQINWFSRVFEPDEIETSVPYFYVHSWKEAKPLFRSIKWEWTTNEAGNELSSHVGDLSSRIGTKYPGIYEVTWNKMAVEAKAILSPMIEPKVEELTAAHNLSEKFLHCVQWDILFIIMEDVYRDAHPSSLFFAELLKFYEAGHFPCGWKDGRWPKGRLAVA